MTINHRLVENICYPGGSTPYQCFDLYIPLTAQPPFDRLIIHVHGGAWRAEPESVGLIGNLSSHFPTAAICSVNYRLSVGKQNPNSELKHPSHNKDVASAIDHASSLPELKAIQQIYLIGHSAGAFMCLSIAGIFEPPEPDAPRLSRPTSEKIRGLILVDGIYDLVDLLDQYPGYKDFVTGAFAEKASDRLINLHKFSPLSWAASSAINPEKSPRILVIHSRLDSLLTTRQSEVAVNALKSKLSFGDKIETDFDSVSGDHHQLLLSPELASRIKSFIASPQ